MSIPAVKNCHASYIGKLYALCALNQSIQNIATDLCFPSRASDICTSPEGAGIDDSMAFPTPSSVTVSVQQSLPSEDDNIDNAAIPVFDREPAQVDIPSERNHVANVMSSEPSAVRLKLSECTIPSIHAE